MNSQLFLVVFALSAFSYSTWAASLTPNSANNPNNSSWAKDCPKFPDHFLECIVQVGISATDMSSPEKINALMCCKNGRPLLECVQKKASSDSQCKLPMIDQILKVDYQHAIPQCAQVTCGKGEEITGSHNGATGAVTVPFFAFLAFVVAGFTVFGNRF